MNWVFFFAFFLRQSGNQRWLAGKHHLVGGLVAIFYFPIYWVSNHPNWRTHIFQRGGPTTNQSSFSSMLLDDFLLKNRPFTIWAFPRFSTMLNTTHFFGHIMICNMMKYSPGILVDCLPSCCSPFCSLVESPNHSIICCENPWLGRLSSSGHVQRGGVADLGRSMAAWPWGCRQQKESGDRRMLLDVEKWGGGGTPKW